MKALVSVLLVLVAACGSVGGNEDASVPMDGNAKPDAAIDGGVADASADSGPPGSNLWVSQAGGTGDDRVLGVAGDGSNNVIVVGRFEGTAKIGGVTLTSAGSTDAFVAKLSATDGHALWAKRFGGAGLGDTAVSVAVNAMGDVFVFGDFNGTVDFGNGAITSTDDGRDGFLLKLSGANGSTVWSDRVGGAGLDQAVKVAVDSSGDVFAMGQFRGNTSVGGQVLVNAGPPGSDDIFLAKYAGSSGAHIWSKSIGGMEDDYGFDLKVDGHGDAVLIGDFEGAVNFGGSGFVSAGKSDVFLAKYAGGTGAHLFSKTYGSTGVDHGIGVAIDGASGLYMVGDFTGTVSFGGAAPLVATAGEDTFLVKVSLAGAHIWSRSFGGSSQEFSAGIAIDPTGNVVITGTFFETTSLGGSELSSAGDADVYVAKYVGATGLHLGSMRLGGASFEGPEAIASGPAGQTFVVGHFQAFAEFGGTSLTSAGSNDGFVLALSPL